jgi:hypothetical protein
MRENALIVASLLTRSRDPSLFLRHPSVYSCCLATTRRGDATRWATCLRLGSALLGMARRKHRFVYYCVIRGACFDVTILTWHKCATIFSSNLHLGPQCGLFRFFFQNFVFMSVPMHATCLVNLILCGFTIQSAFYEKYKLWNCSLCSFLHHPSTFSLGPNILLSTLLLLTLCAHPLNCNLAVAGWWPAAGFLVVALLQNQANELPAVSECVNFVTLINNCLIVIFKYGKLFLECHFLCSFVILINKCLVGIFKYGKLILECRSLCNFFILINKCSVGIFKCGKLFLLPSAVS